MSDLNQIYADVNEDDSVGEPNFQWVVLASEALAREAALREELTASREAFKEELDGVKYTRRKFRQERDALQQRLTVAERYVKKLIDCSKGQDSIATGYLSDILDLLKPSAECEHSFHHFGTEQKRRRCNWCNKLEAAEGEGS